jgi:hypothetical protein
MGFQRICHKWPSHNHIPMLCFHSCMGRVSPQEAQKAHPIGPLKPSKIAMLLFLLLPLLVQRSRHCLARLNLAWPGNHDVASTVPFISTNKVDQNEVMAPQPSATTVPSLGQSCLRKPETAHCLWTRVSLSHARRQENAIRGAN